MLTRPRTELRSRKCAVLVAGAFFALLIPFLAAAPAAAHTPHDDIADVALSPQYDRDGTVYTISRDYLLKSQDRGETWHKLVNGLDVAFPIASVEISQQDPNLLYAASRSGGVFKSTDAGGSWTRIGHGLPSMVTLLAVSPHSGAVVFAAGPRGLFATGDGGGTWRRVDGINGEHATDVAFAADRPEVVAVSDHQGFVHVSENNGSTWTSTTIKGASDGVTAVAVSPNYAQDRTIFAGTASRGIFKSVDGGASYERSDNGVNDDRIRSLLVSQDYVSDSTLWATTWKDGVFESDDAGAHWTSRSTGLTTNRQADLIGVPHFGTVEGFHTAIGTTLFVAGFNGLFRSDDGAGRWDEVQTQSAGNITGLSISPDYAEDSTVAVATYINGIRRSTDGGKTWTAQNDGVAIRGVWLERPDYVARLMGIYFAPTYARDHTVFSGTRGFWFRSTDRGETWRAVIPRGALVKNEDPPDYFIPAFSPNYAHDRTIILATDRGKVFRSTDAGRSFTKVATVGTAHFVALSVSPEYAKDGRLFGATSSNIVTSSDRGETWSKTADPPSRVTNIVVSPDYANDHAVYIATWRGVAVTHDNGEHWTTLTAPAIADGYVEGLALSPEYTHDHTMLVSIRGRGLFKSTDGGTTFRAVGTDLIANNVELANFYHYTSPPIVFSPTYATDHTVFGFAEEAVYKSEDGGDSWTEIDVPLTEHAMTVTAAPRGVLETPRFGAASTELVTTESPQGTSGTLTSTRLLAAALAGVLVFGIVLIAPIARKRSVSRYLVSAACGVLVFAGLLAVLIAWG
jgi:photosystem II stability/assembly factor-like uncharacterized protein